MLSKYYGFSIDEINDMTIYQFQNYLNNIGEIEKMKSGDKSNKTDPIDPVSNEDLVNRAKKLGLKVPRYY